MTVELDAAVPFRSVEALVEAAAERAHPGPLARSPAVPLSTWRHLISQTAERLWPELPRDRALRRLGREFTLALARTPVGSVLAANAQRLAPERVMAKLPLYAQVVRHDLLVDVRPVGLHDWAVDVADAQPLPDFFIGCLEQIFAFAGVEPAISVRAVRPDGYGVHVAWPSSG